MLRLNLPSSKKWLGFWFCNFNCVDKTQFSIHIRIVDNLISVDWNLGLCHMYLKINSLHFHFEYFRLKKWQHYISWPEIGFLSGIFISIEHDQFIRRYMFVFKLKEGKENSWRFRSFYITFYDRKSENSQAPNFTYCFPAQRAFYPLMSLSA